MMHLLPSLMRSSRHIALTSIVIALLVLGYSCTPRLSDQEKATQQIEHVRQLITANQLNTAKIQLDSLHIKYRTQVAQRRIADHLADSITRIESLRTIAYCDSMLIIKQEEKKTLIKNFRLDKNEKYQTEGNYVSRLLRTESNAERCYMQAYVTESADVHFKSTYCGTFAIEHTSLSLTASETSVDSPTIPTANAANHTFTDSGLTWETLNYKNEDALALLNFISANQDTRIRVSLLGKRKYYYTLMESEKKALGLTYHFAIVMRDIAQLETEVKKAQHRIAIIEHRK